MGWIGEEDVCVVEAGAVLICICTYIYVHRCMCVYMCVYYIGWGSWGRRRKLVLLMQGLL